MEYQAFNVRLQNSGIDLSGTSYYSDSTTGKTWDNPWYPTVPDTGYPGSTPGLPNGTELSVPGQPTFTLLPPESVDLEKLKMYFVALQNLIINLFKSGDMKQATFFALVDEIQKMESVLLGVNPPTEDTDEDE